MNLCSNCSKCCFSADATKLAELGTQQAALIGQQNLIRSKLTEVQGDIDKKANIDDVNKISGEVSNNAIELNTFSDKIKNLEASIESSINNMEPKAIDPIFFSATADGVPNAYTKAGIMPFKTIKEQMGGGFDPAGTFVAPQAGIFYFSFDLSKYAAASTTHASLHHNDVELCQGYISESDRHYHMLGCSSTVNLKAGDRVYVQFRGGKLQTGIYSTFTGVRILPMS